MQPRLHKYTTGVYNYAKPISHIGTTEPKRPYFPEAIASLGQFGSKFAARRTVSGAFFRPFEVKISHAKVV
jgi:hypothetical protein